MPSDGKQIGQEMAVGTRTAPTVDGTPTLKRISVTYMALVEESPRSESYIVDGAATNVQIEAFVAALQDLTTASISAVGVTDIYSGLALKSNATSDGKVSADAKMIIRARNNAHNNIRYLNVPAPHNTNFVAESEDIISDVATNTELGALLTAWSPLDAGYEAQAVYFSERQETNKANLF